MEEIKFLTDEHGNMFAQCGNNITVSVQGIGNQKTFMVFQENENKINTIGLTATNYALSELFKKFIDGLEENKED